MTECAAGVQPMRDGSWLGAFHMRPTNSGGQREATLQPELPIVDPHHHLWDLPTHRYLADELLADLRCGHHIAATVFVEASSMYWSGDPVSMKPVGETRFVADFAAEREAAVGGLRGICAGIVGFADLRLGSAIVPVLEAHCAEGGGRFRGIRNVSAWDADPGLQSKRSRPIPGLLGDASFRQGLAQLAPLGLSFDAGLYFTQLAELGELAAAFPQTTIVLNHTGGVIGVGPYAGAYDAVFTTWRNGLMQLAQHPNIRVKLGGLGMKSCGFAFTTGEYAPSSAELAAAWAPYIETCISIFGAERCMFESNFPVDGETCTYHALWNAFKRITAGYSTRDKTALFSGTAAGTYRLVLPCDAPD
jgi:L-fuconolactonase